LDIVHKIEGVQLANQQGVPAIPVKILGIKTSKV
jgi:hypothetical protein